MGAINRLPNGLLSYVDTQTQGINPAILGEAVNPTLDMEPFYRSLARYGQTTTTGAGALPGSTSAGVTVPVDEVWHIHAATVEVTNTLAAICTNLRGYIILSAPNALSYVVLAGLTTAGALTLNPTDIAAQGAVFARPVVAPPGYIISILLNQFVAVATLDTRSTILFNRMQI